MDTPALMKGKKMEIEFVKELDGSYLTIGTTGEGAAFETKMLLFGDVPGLLPFRLLRADSGLNNCYEISALQSLSSLLKARTAEPEEIRELIRALYRCCEALKKYLLRPDGLYLEPGLIFKGRDGWRFCYHPDRDEDIFEQIRGLSRFFLKKCNHDEPESARLAYSFFQVTHEDNTSFPQILSLWGEERQSGETLRFNPAKKGWRRFFAGGKENSSRDKQR